MCKVIKFPKTIQLLENDLLYLKYNKNLPKSLKNQIEHILDIQKRMKYYLDEIKLNNGKGLGEVNEIKGQ